MLKPIRLASTIAGVVTLNSFVFSPIFAAPVQAKTTFEIVQAPTRISTEILKNATYTIPDQGTYTLNQGSYDADNIKVSLIKPIALGDVDQDGDQDGAVILAVDTGGSGIFIYLAVATINGDQVSNPDTYFLGDRVRVQSLTIKDGQIRLNLLKHQADDPQCCPSQLVSMAYQLDNQTGTLKSIELSEQEKQKIHTEDLPSQMLPGDDNVPFQPQDDQFQIQF
jgi:hypothetical protein